MIPVFNEVWNKFTFDTKGAFIDEEKVLKFLTSLPSPLGKDYTFLAFSY
jgi:hypothetical protein